jgi:hypothetical protein
VGKFNTSAAVGNTNPVFSTTPGWPCYRPPAPPRRFVPRFRLAPRFSIWRTRVAATATVRTPEDGTPISIGQLLCLAVTVAPYPAVLPNGTRLNIASTNSKASLCLGGTARTNGWTVSVYLNRGHYPWDLSRRRSKSHHCGYTDTISCPSGTTQSTLNCEVVFARRLTWLGTSVSFQQAKRPRSSSRPQSPQGQSCKPATAATQVRLDAD